MLTALGCATGGRVAAGAAVSSAPGLAAAPRTLEGGPGQWLFRVEISGDEGSASLRLMLRRRDAERFTLSAADAVGQARWEVRRDGDEALWVDPQSQLFCRLDPRRPLQARLAVPSIPLADFPGLLTGEWPSPDLVAESATGVSAARPFTAERAAGGGWTSWTLWQGGEPVAWFKRLEADSLLSVRRPSVQVRWRVSAQSDLPRPAAAAGETSPVTPPTSWAGELPPGAREMVCPDNAIP